MPGITFRLTNDDEPRKLAPRLLLITRPGLSIEGQPAVAASVDPPLTGNGWGDGTSEVILVSRTRGVSIDEIINDKRLRPARVYVCRYVGQEADLPPELPQAEVEIGFWGKLE